MDRKQKYNYFEINDVIFPSIQLEAVNGDMITVIDYPNKDLQNKITEEGRKILKEYYKKLNHIKKL